MTAPRLSCGMQDLRCPKPCGILVPWPGIEPVSPALMEVDSLPLDHQGSALGGGLKETLRESVQDWLLLWTPHLLLLWTPQPVAELHICLLIPDSTSLSSACYPWSVFPKVFTLIPSPEPWLLAVLPSEGSRSSWASLYAYAQDSERLALSQILLTQLWFGLCVTLGKWP